MQIALEVVRGRIKHPGDVKLNDLRIPFIWGEQEQVTEPLADGQAAPDSSPDEGPKLPGVWTKEKIEKSKQELRMRNRSLTAPPPVPQTALPPAQREVRDPHQERLDRWRNRRKPE